LLSLSSGLQQFHTPFTIPSQQEEEEKEILISILLLWFTYLVQDDVRATATFSAAAVFEGGCQEENGEKQRHRGRET